MFPDLKFKFVRYRNHGLKNTATIVVLYFLNTIFVKISEYTFDFTGDT